MNLEHLSDTHLHASKGPPLFNELQHIFPPSYQATICPWGRQQEVYPSVTFPLHKVLLLPDTYFPHLSRRDARRLGPASHSSDNPAELDASVASCGRTRLVYNFPPLHSALPSSSCGFPPSLHSFPLRGVPPIPPRRLSDTAAARSTGRRGSLSSPLSDPCRLLFNLSV